MPLPDPVAFRVTEPVDVVVSVAPAWNVIVPELMRLNVDPVDAPISITAPVLLKETDPPFVPAVIC